MKIRIEQSEGQGFFELEAEEDETIGSIRRRVVEKNITMHEYKDYEYYDRHSVEQECNKLQLSKQPLNRYKKGDLEDSTALKDLGNITIYQRSEPRPERKFTLSDPNISFEFIDQSILKHGVHTIGELKQYFKKALGLDCAIFLKKIGLSEYLELQDKVQVPYIDLFIKFDSEIQVADRLSSRLGLLESDKMGLLNPKVHGHTPTSLKEYFEHFTTAKKEKPELPPTPYKYFIATGALAGLVSTVATSYLFRNPLAESALCSIAPGISMAAATIKSISSAAFGMGAGGLFGFAASCVYSYARNLNSSDSKQSEMLQ